MNQEAVIAKRASMILPVAASAKENRLTGRIDSPWIQGPVKVSSGRVGGGSSIGTGFSILTLLLVLLGAIVAAMSGAPTFWMLVWPTPLVVTFTVANFVRQGYHKRDGVLVLGRAVASRASHDQGSSAGADVWPNVTGEPERKPELADRAAVNRGSGTRERAFRSARALCWVELP
jgi:hypothetical protein